MVEQTISMSSNIIKRTIHYGAKATKEMIIYDIDTTENGYSKLEGEARSITQLKSILTCAGRIADCTGYLTIEGLKRNSICIAALSAYGVSIAITDAEGVHLTLQDADKLTEVVDVWGDGLDISIGLFIPEELAWQVLAEYINDRTFSKDTQWIMSADIPEGGNYIC